MKKNLKAIFAALVFAVCCSFFTFESQAAPMLKLWLEAQVEDGDEAVWKFYLYGTESAGSGEMTCTFGSRKYEGTWTTTSVSGRIAYRLAFESEQYTPEFTMHNGNSMRLTSCAIEMTGNDEANFIVETMSGTVVRYGSAASDGQVTRHVFDCELLD